MLSTPEILALQQDSSPSPLATPRGDDDVQRREERDRAFQEAEAELALLEAEAASLTPGRDDSAAAKAQAEREEALRGQRQQRLREVFCAFDANNNGTIEVQELYSVGKALNSLAGQAEWTQEQNTALLLRMDVNHDGVVQVAEWLRYCEELLPRDETAFEAVALLSPVTSTTVVWRCNCVAGKHHV